MTDLDLHILPASHADVAALARLTKQLLEDEGNRVQPNLVELAARLSDWTTGREWSVDLFKDEKRQIVGYIVHGRRFNAMAPHGDEIYVRQFAVDRAHRRSGLGRRAIALFIAQRCTPGARVMLDVLESNPAGQAFWREVGFAPHAKIMEMSVPKPDSADG